MKWLRAPATAAFIVAAMTTICASANTPFPSDLLDSTLGKAPDHYKKSILADAKKFKSAMDLFAQKKITEARTRLRGLKNSHFKELALLELSRLEMTAQRPDAALNALNELKAFPVPPSVERILSLRERDALFASAMLKVKSAQTKATKAAAVQALQHAFSRTPHREWQERPEPLIELLTLMKSTGDPLWKNQVSEALLALPASAPVRKKITDGIAPKDLQDLSAFPRFRSGAETSVPVKAVYPDYDLFEQGMAKVLEEEWTEAEDLFNRLLKEFPSSEHTDRAQFWVARMLEERGLQEEAKKRYQDIFLASPLSYYGLESALRSGQQPLAEVKDTEPAFSPITGALLPRQQQGLWRLRALLETGLLEYAKIQMEELFYYRPNGLFGQEDPNRALSLAFLYHWSGYHLGAFTQAYGATSLDRALLTNKTLNVIFPEPFSAEIKKASDAAKVHPLLVRALIKQESAFLPQAISRSNAMGLMQLLFSTAQDVEKNISRDDLFTPEANTRVGSGYLRYLLDRFDGNIALALAGYNAGPSRAMSWQKKLMESSLMKKEFRVDVFIDTIPFTETRRYVGSVLRNYWWYRARSGLPPAKSVQELVQLWQNEENKM